MLNLESIHLQTLAGPAFVFLYFDLFFTRTLSRLLFLKKAAGVMAPAAENFCFSQPAITV